MATETSVGAKTCCQCGKNVAGKKRMRDSEGRYWCIPCGEEDRRRKRMTAEGKCAGCGDLFPPSQLTEFGKLPYCQACIKKTYAEPKSNAMSRIASVFMSGGDSKRLFILLAIMAVIGIAAFLLNFYSRVG